ncbi:threonine 3-dehydrogenase [Marinomonas polaris DSM 16579]|uniref:Threonine 3-dehydrogenase n=1 Tax=Marinomonas polaris DSM 16579 TaxID=1122206 RepID=A0A1M4V5H5_9GAMM|nr:alcohol dehydrogenase catalytic domain-containing protein [Marinomonas polaris]SHE64152.1 threonine 3-dehydrogenase [Marinomonas polaris DSM 16579]
MLALRKSKPELGIELIEVPELGLPEAKEVRISVLAAGICGSDLHVYEWTKSYEWMRSKLPVTLGHEFVGEINAIGDEVQGLKVGQRVVVRPSVTCGECTACKANNPDGCRTRDSIGMLRDGGFARQVFAPEKNCLVIPDSLSADIAALTEPFTIAAQAVNIAELKSNQKVAVFGPGTIGQAIAVLAKEAGCRVTVIGKNDAFRLQSTREVGIESTLDWDDADFDTRLNCMINDGAFDVVFEAAGAAPVLAKAMSILEPNGVLVVAGIYGQDVPVDLTSLVRKQFQIKGSFRPLESIWPQMVEFLCQHAERLKPMVSHVLPLERGEEGFRLSIEGKATKIVIKPE